MKITISESAFIIFLCLLYSLNGFAQEENRQNSPEPEQKKEKFLENYRIVLEENLWNSQQ